MTCIFCLLFTTVALVLYLFVGVRKPSFIWKLKVQAVNPDEFALLCKSLNLHQLQWCFHATDLHSDVPADSDYNGEILPKGINEVSYSFLFTDAATLVYFGVFFVGDVIPV